MINVNKVTFGYGHLLLFNLLLKSKPTFIYKQHSDHKVGS